MKAEVTQHAVRIIDAVDALQGQNERSCQLRTMAAFFILIAKFHNCSHIKVCLNNFILKLFFSIYQDGRIFTLFIIFY